jgi:transglutaminase-like putative cysteine protease
MSPKPTFLQRIRTTWHSYVREGDWFALLLAIVLMLMPALALKTAQFPLELRTVVPTIILGSLFGFVLARSRYGELFALVMTLLYGVIVVVALAGLNEPTNPANGVYEVLSRTTQWVYDAFTGGINQDDTIFTLLISLFFWICCYVATWFIFRADRVGIAITLPAIMLVGVMVIYTGRNSLDIYLAVFVLMALLLVVRSSIETREMNWFYNGIRVPRRLRPQFMRVGVVMAVLCLLFAWVIPSDDVQQRLKNFQEFLQSDPFQRMSDFWNRLFSPIEAEGPATADYYGSELLSLGGAIRLGDQPILYVQAPPEQRYYWRSRVFERYDLGQWSPSSTWRVTDGSAPINFILTPDFIGQKRVPILQIFTIGNGGSRLVYTAPQPQEISVGGRVDLTRLDETLGDNSPVNISVVRPLRVLETGMSYTVTSLLSVASADELRNAGTNYPQWVSNPNAMIGLSLSPRVMQLARDIVTNAGATTPYDQTKAIEQWLRTNMFYNETISAPPLDRDPVEWFLFDLREGYCTYYATAMATMLRSLGIPARLAAGFSEGDYDPAIGQYVVRERDAHTWVEVYFPGYGWIEFEPTTAEEPLNRDGDNIVSPQSQEQGNPPTAVPSFTPTQQPSPTPLPTNTPPPTPERQEQDEQNNPSTLTPTPSPTPTVTPVIVPTVAPPIAPPPPPRNDFLSFLLPALGAALAIFLAIMVVVLIGTLIWWWWEWRGMGGLSPIARAYKRLERYIALIGIRTSEKQTPDEKRRLMVGKLPQAERPITHITRAYTRERYAPPNLNTPDALRDMQTSDKAWLEARRNILRRWARKFIPFRRQD